MRTFELGALSALFCLGMMQAYGQKNRTSYYEIGGGAGVATMQTEVSNRSSVEAFYKEARPLGNVFIKYHLSDWFGLGTEMSYGALYAKDANHKKQSRGVTSRSRLFQANAFTEIHFIRFGKYHRENPFTLYLKGGAGFNTWDPTVETSAPLEEYYEKEVGAYTGFGAYIGAGFKFRLGYHSILSLELRSGGVGGNNLEGLRDTRASAAPGDDSYTSFQVSYSWAFF